MTFYISRVKTGGDSLFMSDSTRRLLILDFDGVIIDSIDVVKKIFNTLRRKYNLPKFITNEEVGKMYEINFFELLRQRGVSQEVVNDYPEDSKKLYQLYADDLEPFQGMGEMIKTLSKHYTFAIVSSNHGDVIKKFLVKNKIESFFISISGAEQAASKIDKLNQLILKSDVVRNRVFFITDTVADILEGKRAGVMTVGVSWGFHSKLQLLRAKPDLVFDTIDELQKHFQNQVLI